MKALLLRAGDGITVGLVVTYVVLAAVYAVAQLWAKATYWIGAAVLTFAVLRMK